MKLPLLAILASTALAAGASAQVLVDPTVQFRLGWDSNPVASNSATPALGETETLTTGASAGFGVRLPLRAAAWSSQLTYLGELTRFEDRSDENFGTHRFAAGVQGNPAEWKITADGSALIIDGNHDTLASFGASNANAVTLWRERRAQTQFRAKALAQHDRGNLRLRLAGTLLDYHYRTRIRSGYVAFADRGDLFGGADAGWKQSGNSVWFAGVRRGMQQQDTLPVAGGTFEYSNGYTRVLAGWEGKLGTDTTLAFAAGPDFRRYDGAVDPRVFRGRNRTLGWFETSFTHKFSPQLSLTAKSARWAWLSSTGKSAYTDLSGEAVLAWTYSKTMSFRASAKLHQCSYFPIVRNDWESLGGVGVTYKASTRWQLAADLLDHRGWNELSGVADRSFGRTVIALSAVLKL